MTDIYSLEDKISNIRKVVRNLTGDCYSTSEYKPVLLKEIDSNSSRNSQNSLENFLEGKFEEQPKGRKKDFHNDLTTNHTFDYEKPDKYSRESFKGPYSNKIMTSFLSDEFSSLKFVEGASDLAALLEHEKENVRKLETRVLQKDKIIDEMNQRQMALTDELAGLKRSGGREEVEEYKVVVSNLQEKLEKYMNQVNFLQNHQRPTPEFKKTFSDDEVQSRISYLERQLSDQNLLMDELHSKTQKIKQDQALIADLKIQIEKKDKTIAELVNENKDLNVRINESSFNKKDSRQDFREFKLREEVNRLRQVNEDLFAKFKRIESEGQLKTKNFNEDKHRRDKSANVKNSDYFNERENVDFLKENAGKREFLDEKKANRHFSNERKRENKELSNERERKRDISNARRRSCSSQRVLVEITDCLHCGKSEIMTKLRKLKRSERLEQRLEMMIRDLSSQTGELTTKHIWKCIRGLVEEYIVLKKGNDGSSVLTKLSKILSVKDSEVVNQVKKLTEEQKNMNTLVDKIKKMLCLSPHAALQEVEDTLDEKS